MEVTKYLTLINSELTYQKTVGDTAMSLYVPVLCEMGAHSSVTFPNLHFDWLQQN